MAETGPSDLLTVFSETVIYILFFSGWITAASSMRLTTCYKSICAHPCCLFVCGYILIMSSS